MSGNFMNKTECELNSACNYQGTENGTLDFKTAGHALLDLNFSVTSLRTTPERDIAERFIKAFLENRLLAMKWLFFARDTRGGLGERKIFQSIIKHMAVEYPEIISAVLKLIPVYGRYNDWWCLLETNLKDEVMRLVINQLDSDIRAMKNCLPCSQLAKWMPSENRSSRKTVANAKIIRYTLKMRPEEYRKLLVKLRTHINSIECQIPSKSWDKVECEEAALVSGFDDNIVKMVLSEEPDPYRCLAEQLSSERYNAVEDALKTMF